MSDSAGVGSAADEPSSTLCPPPRRVFPDLGKKVLGRRSDSKRRGAKRASPRLRKSGCLASRRSFRPVPQPKCPCAPTPRCPLSAVPSGTGRIGGLGGGISEGQEETHTRFPGADCRDSAGAPQPSPLPSPAPRAAAVLISHVLWQKQTSTTGPAPWS